MKFYSSVFVLLFAVLGICAAALPGLPRSAAQGGNAPAAAREEAYRANNLGVALLEQYKYKEGAEAFGRALQLDPKLALARINLSIALFNVPDLRGAQREAEAAAALAPNAPQPLYILGLVARNQNRADDAISAFQRVLRIDPRDVGANVQLGQLLSQQRKYAEAVAAFRTAISAEPYNMTAIYNLATALQRTGEREEGARMIERFQALRQSGAGTTIGQNYLEQGRYAEAVASTGAEPDLVDRAAPAVTFKDATASMLPPAPKGLPSGASSASSAAMGRRYKPGELSDATRREIAASLGGSLTPFDFDGDGDLDLFAATTSGRHLYRNDDGRFVDVTAQSASLFSNAAAIETGAVAGDYDNDTRPDLFVIRDTGLALYHNDGNGKFSDVTSAAGIPRYPYLSSATAFVDLDHDGDLDIVVGGLADLGKPAQGEARFPEDFAPAPNVLLRNDGNGKFSDMTAISKVSASPGHVVAIVPTDYDNRRDVDLLLISYGKAPELFSNQRDGSFRDVSRDAGLEGEGRWTSAAAGDVNKDGFTDFFFGRNDGPGLFAMSDGKGRFKTSTAPGGSEMISATQFLDYDGDGLLDCLMLSSAGLRVLRNVGDGWTNVTERGAARDIFAAGDENGAGRLFVAGDMDTDGDTDLILVSAAGDVRAARNEGGNQNASVRVRLAGKVSNRSGVGAKIEARAGSLIQKLETYAASPAPAPSDIIFGLGKRAAPDAVRVLWPAGIVQAETEIKATVNAPTTKKTATALVLPVTELDRKPSSCPYLYAWDGERFSFITDFMGAAEMGYWEGPGHFNTPDPDEYVRIRGDQLRERDGRYELRITNELEEALFIDRVQLLAVSHPREVEVYPNEGMTSPPRPFVLYKTRRARPPITATDDHGHDVLARITHLDRQAPDDFRLDRVRGYADEHTLTMKLDDGTSKGARTLLLLTGWTSYSWSSDNVAASQSGKQARLPALQVKDAQGRWRTVIEDIGIPVGRPQTVTVDLTGKFLSESREVRILTNMRIYWDQVLVDTSGGDFPASLLRLDPLGASLRWRGFSGEVSPDGREPFGYDYETVSYTSPWKVMPGRYTREGDVRELLNATDDVFVISRPGDEVILSFDASCLPALPHGWTRTFLLYADGFSKEMDINSASPSAVAPLPFHGMKKYPYTAPDAYPMTEARRALYEKYNTRIVTAEVPSIETTYAAALIFGPAGKSGRERAEGRK